MIGYLALILMVLLTTAAQVCIKLGVSRIPAAKNWLVLIRAGFNTYIVLAGIFIVSAAVAYIFALTRVPLNIAYSFTGFNYILVFLASWRILKEKVNVLQFIGVALIFLGILTWNI
jgi:multidrug transporter EmrE-like cation transporter